ncbi:MAG: YhdT family protein [Selenomonadaceae bacterium]|nr:YhdT family protein [Selenomonadaceae bacterium]
MNNKTWSPYEKYRQVQKEAKATGVLLALLILFWCFAGFGLSGVDAEIFGLPLWAVLGTVGVWAFAIVGVSLLVRGVFRDMPLDDEESTSGGTAPAAKGGDRA